MIPLCVRFSLILIRALQSQECGWRTANGWKTENFRVSRMKDGCRKKRRIKVLLSYFICGLIFLAKNLNGRNRIKFHILQMILFKGRSVWIQIKWRYTKLALFEIIWLIIEFVQFYLINLYCKLFIVEQFWNRSYLLRG